MACDSGVGRLGFLEGSERSVESGLGCTGLGPPGPRCQEAPGVHRVVFLAVTGT